MKPQSKKIRLLFPQWQGGNMGAYYLGSQLLNWLAPEPDCPVETVDVPLPDNNKPQLENGIFSRQALLRQADQARSLIEKHQPEQIVVFGGDCLIDLVPFAYMNEKYDGDLAVLWVDAHPDVMTPKEIQNAHAMVLGNLLGHGDADFVQRVKRPIKPQNVLYAGLQKTLDMESAFIAKHNLKSVGPKELVHSSEPVLQWLKNIDAKHVAIHLDLDVLDMNKFHALYFARPDAPEGAFDGIAQGEMTIQHIVRLLNDVAKAVDVSVLGIAEHLPWDAIELHKMLRKLPLIGCS